jgi:RNA polymerase sigma factor (sigma-70 family)
MRSKESQRILEQSRELTPRQRDVAALLVGTGLSYKEIAVRLGCSEGTMRTHTEKIYRALGVHSRPELTVALRAGENAALPARLGC